MNQFAPICTNLLQSARSYRSAFRVSHRENASKWCNLQFRRHRARMQFAVSSSSEEGPTVFSPFLSPSFIAPIFSAPRPVPEHGGQVRPSDVKAGSRTQSPKVREPELNDHTLHAVGGYSASAFNMSSPRGGRESLPARACRPISVEQCPQRRGPQRRDTCHSLCGRVRPGLAALRWRV